MYIRRIGKSTSNHCSFIHLEKETETSIAITAHDVTLFVMFGGGERDIDYVMLEHVSLTVAYLLSSMSAMRIGV